MVNSLYELGLVAYSNKIDNLNLQVNFIDDSGEPILKISDFRELGYEYMLYKGGNYFRCKHCGILVKQNKNGTRKYCKDCIGYQPIEKKTIVCCDCGKEFEVDSRNTESNRCAECYKKYRRKYKTQKDIERYYKNKNFGQRN